MVIRRIFCSDCQNRKTRLKNIRAGLNNRFSRLVKNESTNFYNKPRQTNSILPGHVHCEFCIHLDFLMAERFGIFYWAISIVIFAVCFLLVFFDTDTTIICDEVGCTVKRKRFWESSVASYELSVKRRTLAQNVLLLSDAA